MEFAAPGQHSLLTNLSQEAKNRGSATGLPFKGRTATYSTRGAGVGTVLIREWRGVSRRVTVLDREQETGAVVLSRRESSQRRDSMIVMHRIFQPSPTGPLDFEATIEWTLLM